MKIENCKLKIGLVTFAIFAFSISAHAAGTITQRAYIFQNDDAADSNPNNVSRAAVANTALTGVNNGQRFIVRFQIDGTASKSNWKIQYDKNDSHWQDVGASSASYQAFNPTPLFSFGNIATKSLTTNLAGTCSGGATFVSGEISWNSNLINTFGLGTGNKCSEIAFGVRTASVAYNSTYRFRLNITNVASGSVSTFSQYPTITTVTSGNDTIRYSKYLVGPSMTASRSIGFLSASSSYPLSAPLDSLGYASVSTDNSKFDNIVEPPEGNFGTSGVVTVTAGATADSMALDSNYIYIAGNEGASDWRIEKRNRVTGNICDGVGNCADGNFGTSGVITVTAGAVAYSIEVDSNYIYIAGYDDASDWRIEKRNRVTGNICDGSGNCADGNFGTSGVVTVTAGNIAWSIAIDSNYIYIAGIETGLDWRIEKRNRVTGNICDGSGNCADGNFGTSGVITVTAGDTAQSIVVDSNYIYIAGYEGAFDWRIEKRNRVTGNICDGAGNCADGNFGTSGVITVTAGQMAHSIALDSNYIYIAGYDSGNDWRIEKRNRVTGNICDGTGNCADGNFGTSGVITVTAGTQAQSIVVDSNYIYIAGYEGASDWRIEKRNRVTGNICDGTGNCADGNFGTSGVVTVTAGQIAYSIAIDSSYIYISGYEGSQDWRIEKRNRVTGNICDGTTNCPYPMYSGSSLFFQDSAGLYKIASSSINAIGWNGTYWLVAEDNSKLVRISQNRDNSSFTNVSANLSGFTASSSINAVDWNGSNWLIGGGYGKLNRCNFDASSCAKVTLNLSGYASTSINTIRSNENFSLIGGNGKKFNSCNINVTSCTNISNNLSLNFGDVTFGSKGSISVAAGQIANSIAVDSNYIYIAGFDDAGDWRIEKRNRTTGNLCDGTTNCADGNFGTSGVVTVAAGTSVNSIAIDLNYVYIVGHQGSTDWRIEKRNRVTGNICDGVGNCADGNFGTSGVVTVAAGTAAYSVAIDSNYIYIAGDGGASDWRIEKRNRVTGNICDGTGNCADGNFGTSGVVTVTAGQVAYSIAVDSSYIYIAGMEGAFDWRIEKRNRVTGNICNGAGNCADGNFGTSGVITVTAGDIANSIAVDSNYIYIAGDEGAFGGDWRIEKRNRVTGNICDGVGNCADGNFGTSGVVTVAAGDIVYSIVADSNYIYIAGVDNSSDWRIEKRNRVTGNICDGVGNCADGNFGTSGVVTVTAGQVAQSIAVDSNYIYIAGYQGASDWRIEKRNRVTGNYCSGSGYCGSSINRAINALVWNGTFWLVGGDNANLNKCIGPDAASLCSDVTLSSFGTSSVRSIGYNGTYWLAGGDDGKLNRCNNDASSCTYVSGSLSNYASSSIQSIQWNGSYWLIGAGNEKKLNRCNIDTSSCADISGNIVNPGQSNTQFGTSGVVTVTAGALAYSMAIDSNYIYIAGYDDASDWRIEKRNRITGNICDGAGNCADGNFGTSGVVTVTGTNGNTAQSIVVDSNYIYIAGDDNNTNDWRIEKRNRVTGNICSSTANCADGNFGTSGVVTVTAGVTAYSIAVDSNYIYIGGYDNNSDWRIEKRNRVTGNICSSTANCADGNFGTSGVVTADAASEQAFTLALDSNYIYIGGYDNNFDWRIEKRNRVTGNICSSTANCADGNFGTSGVVTADAGFTAESIAVDSNYIYIAGRNISTDWYIEKRNRVTGNICDGAGNCADGAFNTDGIITVTTGTIAYSIAVDSNYVYIAGYEASGWRIEKYNRVTGNICSSTANCADGNFGTSGVVTVVDPIAFSIAVDSNYIYIAGYCCANDWRIEKYNRVTGSICDGTAGNCTESSRIKSAIWNGTSWLVGGGTLDSRLNRCSLDGAVCEDLFEGLKGFGTSNIRTLYSGTSSGTTRWLIGGATAGANRCYEDIASCSFVTLSNFGANVASASNFANAQFAIGGAGPSLNSCPLTGGCTDRVANLTGVGSINAIYGSGSYWVIGGNVKDLNRCPIGWGACTDVSGNLSAGWLSTDAIKTILWTGSRWFIGGGASDLDVCTGADVTSCTAVALSLFDTNQIRALAKNSSYILVGGAMNRLNRCALDGTNCIDVSSKLFGFSFNKINSLTWTGTEWIIAGDGGKINSCNRDVTACTDVSAGLTDNIGVNNINSVGWSGNYLLMGANSAKLARAYERFPVYHFVVKNTNNTDPITVTWNGKSLISAASKSYTFQVFNFNTNKWETNITNTTLAADTEGTITGTVTSNNSNYYDSNFYTHWRFYQQAGLETLSTDYISFAFTGGGGGEGENTNGTYGRMQGGGGPSGGGVSGGGTPQTGGGQGGGTGGISGNTGLNFPTATGEDHNEWGLGSNAFSDDNINTTEFNLNDKQDYYNFDLSIPSGATINGIEIKVENLSTGPDCNSFCVVGVELSWDGGTSYTTAGYDTGTVGSSRVVDTLGGPTDTWGRAWSDTNLSNSNFRLRLNEDVSGPPDSVAVDYVQVKVYYTTAGEGGSGGGAPQSGGGQGGGGASPVMYYWISY